MQFARCGVETVVSIHKGDVLYRGAISLSLEERPRIGFHILDVLFGIPDGEIRNSGTRVHFYEPVGNAGIGSAQRIARLSVVPPAFHASVVIRRILAHTHLKDGSEHFPVVGSGVGPVATKLHTGMEAENELEVEFLVFLRTPPTNPDVLDADLRATELVVSGGYIDHTAAILVGCVDSRLEGSPVVKSRHGFGTELRGSHDKVGYGPVFCGIKGFDTLLNHLLLLRPHTGHICRKHRQEDHHGRRS